MEQQATRSDVYTRVTDQIIAQLEAGTLPWLKPWKSGASKAMRPLRHNGTPYRGVNVVLLWAAACDRGFRSSTWMTYKQAQAVGAQVRKGETGSLIVFAGKPQIRDLLSSRPNTPHGSGACRTSRQKRRRHTRRNSAPHSFLWLNIRQTSKRSLRRTLH